MKEFLIVVALAHGADMGTSLAAFHRGAGEANPLVVSTQPAPFVAQGVAVVVGESYLLNKLSKKHPKLARGLALVSISGSSAAAIHNMQIYNQLGRAR